MVSKMMRHANLITSVFRDRRKAHSIYSEDVLDREGRASRAVSNRTVFPF